MVKLPSYPKVNARNDLVIIEYEDGAQHVWGREDNPENALNVAEQMDIELKLFSYIQETSDTFLNHIIDSITSIADETMIYDLIDEALYQWIRKNKPKPTCL
jgi:hypothetical protein